MQLRGLRKRQEEFERRGAEVLLISTDSVPELDLYRDDTGMRLRLLSDRESEVIRAYDLFNDWTPYKRGIPHPTAIVLDAAGIARFVETRQVFLLRTKVQTILDVIDGLAAAPAV